MEKEGLKIFLHCKIAMLQYFKRMKVSYIANKVIVMKNIDPLSANK